MKIMKIIPRMILAVLFLTSQPAFAETLYKVKFTNLSDKKIHIHRDYYECMNDAGEIDITVLQHGSKELDLKDSDNFFRCANSQRYVNWVVSYPYGGDIISCKLTFSVYLRGKWYMQVNGCNELVKKATCGDIDCHNKSASYYEMKDKNINITLD
ncbi:hypothetical protein KKI95_00135 [Xenorhabdus bovienii]|uniref:hypothetical protein n=1 Tax=Xenorhabdus bovienii TaxID=40576 RepID=UPI00237D23F1|nr:hypothetical protein [Xenorhabdus bovienii]MDE1474895.1 hypothetical protein [Xenorhabdus bovienii]MDE1482712.1 hypothetical protein [Xenorhabdus bovienii]MDE1497317.1 hypothetical protein [Xenorhabdus bovienii]MDE9434396.1 hypothetical protein [Xenorhabdus bovienii]MDE9486409.1 hypothetical protein [Xenorhabdus bovienii]